MTKKLFLILILPVLILVGAWFLRGVFATSNPHSWTNGLVGYWSFDGQYTTTTSGVNAGTKDVSNNGNWGVFNGGVNPVGGIVGQALSFDGVNDYVDAGNGASLDMTGDMTIEFWMNPNIWVAGGACRIIDSSDGGWSKGWLVGQDGGPRLFYITAQAGGVKQQSFANPTAITAGVWQHVVIIRSGATATFYVNGVNQTQSSATHIDPDPATGTNTRIGTGIDNWPFNGSLDEVRIYNRVLSIDEIKQHYEQTRRNLDVNQPSGAPPVGWWKMDEGTGQTVRDYSGNNNNGTVINSGYGATSTDGKIGKALSFDGVDDYVNIPYKSSLSSTNALTITAWIYKLTTSMGVIISDKYQNYEFRVSNQLQFEAHYTDIFDETMGTVGKIPINTWTFVAITFDSNDSNRTTLYVNGVYETNETHANKLVDVSNDRYIGVRPVDYWSYFNGFIDDVKIYNYAHTADQIAADYRAGAYRTIIGTSVPSTWWTNGLVGYWSFDGQYTTSTAGTRDVSGNNNWGAFNGGIKPVGGISGQALSFDGVDDYVDAGNGASLKISSDITIEFWVKPNNFTTQGYILSKYAYGVYIGTNGIPNFETRKADNSGWDTTAEGSILTRNVWSHVVAVYNTTTQQKVIYVNGVGGTPISKTDGGMGNSTGYSLYLASYISPPNQIFNNGLIDEVRIYNRALSADEVKQHYEQTRRNVGI